MLIHLYHPNATALNLYVALIDSASHYVCKSTPTLAAGDFTISKDGGAFGNLATLPVVTPAASYGVLIALSSTEMTCAHALIICHDAAGAEWDDLRIIIDTSQAGFMAQVLSGRNWQNQNRA
jgi:hypothetical protein